MLNQDSIKVIWENFKVGFKFNLFSDRFLELSALNIRIDQHLSGNHKKK